jgi:tRNA nucleotidyltransferase/poly(A) polymerase
MGRHNYRKQPGNRSLTAKGAALEASADDLQLKIKTAQHYTVMQNVTKQVASLLYNIKNTFFNDLSLERKAELFHNFISELSEKLSTFHLYPEAALPDFLLQQVLANIDLIKVIANFGLSIVEKLANSVIGCPDEKCIISYAGKLIAMLDEYYFEVLYLVSHNVAKHDYEAACKALDDFTTYMHEVITHLRQQLNRRGITDYRYEMFTGVQNIFETNVLWTRCELDRAFGKDVSEKETEIATREAVNLRMKQELLARNLSEIIFGETDLKEELGHPFAQSFPEFGHNSDAIEKVRNQLIWNFLRVGSVFEKEIRSYISTILHFPTQNAVSVVPDTYNFDLQLTEAETAFAKNDYTNANQKLIAAIDLIIKYISDASLENETKKHALGVAFNRVIILIHSVICCNKIKKGMINTLLEKLKIALDSCKNGDKYKSNGALYPIHLDYFEKQLELLQKFKLERGEIFEKIEEMRSTAGKSAASGGPEHKPLQGPPLDASVEKLNAWIEGSSKIKQAAQEGKQAARKGSEAQSAAGASGATAGAGAETALPQDMSASVTPKPEVKRAKVLRLVDLMPPVKDGPAAAAAAVTADRVVKDVPAAPNAGAAAVVAPKDAVVAPKGAAAASKDTAVAAKDATAIVTAPALPIAPVAEQSAAAASALPPAVVPEARSASLPASTSGQGDKPPSYKAVMEQPVAQQPVVVPVAVTESPPSYADAVAGNATGSSASVPHVVAAPSIVASTTGEPKQPGLNPCAKEYVPKNPIQLINTAISRYFDVHPAVRDFMRDYGLILHGGSIPDIYYASLEGREAAQSDFDFVTSEDLRNLQNRLKSAGISSQLINPQATNSRNPKIDTKRAILQCEIDGKLVEIGHIDADPTGQTFKESAYSRDFTIAGLMYDVNQGIIDFVGGAKDLVENRLRCITFPTETLAKNPEKCRKSPADTFTEDPKRIFRVARYLSKSAKLELDPELKAFLADGYKTCQAHREPNPYSMFFVFDHLFFSGKAERNYNNLQKYKLFDVFFAVTGMDKMLPANFREIFTNNSLRDLMAGLDNAVKVAEADSNFSNLTFLESAEKSNIFHVFYTSIMENLCKDLSAGPGMFDPRVASMVGILGSFVQMPTNLGANKLIEYAQPLPAYGCFS